MKNHFHFIREQIFADQAAHVLSLISIFLVRFLDSIRTVLATSKILLLYAAEQTLLGLTCPLQRRPFFSSRDHVHIRHHDNSTESLLSNWEG